MVLFVKLARAGGFGRGRAQPWMRGQTELPFESLGCGSLALGSGALSARHTPGDLCSPPSSAPGIREEFSNPERPHHHLSGGRGSMEGTVKLDMAEEGM